MNDINEVKERKKLDPYTFGDSKAAVNLAEILSQSGYEKYLSRVSTKYSRFCECMNATSEIRNMSFRSFLCKLIMMDAREKVGKMKIPEEVKSHLLNIMNKLYKMHIKYVSNMIISEKAQEQRCRALERNKREK